ncbi:MgtC/SapB family protein [Dongia deserti]|uniref:MgtC/SapB family protein n=1 Tax=Dongia deserti TaxID=2268030 RepID=UPI000E649D7C|nr:MgtC/SapB family protein [Dongia deserti]
MGMELPLEDLALRLGAASLAGMIIGVEREWRQKPAGLRTHMLVSLAAAAFTIISFELFRTSLEISPGSSGDPIRVIEGVVAGVAFLGAGVIIQARGDVRNLTTGATIWMSGATGLACGGGFFIVAGLLVALSLVILVLLGLLEGKGVGERKD